MLPALVGLGPQVAAFHKQATFGTVLEGWAYFRPCWVSIVFSMMHV